MLADLCVQWMEAKAKEAEAVAMRRALEDRISSLAGIPDTLEGTQTVKPDGYVMKIEGRINRKVDGDKLQEIAIETGLQDHLSSLFRWTPEINMKVWKSTDPAITTPLLGAITSKPGRPSFTITKEK